MLQKNAQDDLDLLLSLDDQVLETPPSSPSDDWPRKRDMSVFRDYVEDCMDYDPKVANVPQKSNQPKASNAILVDKFSKFRILNPEYSPAELSNHFADIKFIHLRAIKNLLDGDALEGIWATTGILAEGGIPRKSSIGKPFTIWKLSCFDEETISVFLFGDAYEKSRGATVGDIYALFNCSVRRDKNGQGFSLSVFSGKHILKLGTSADVGFCQGIGRFGPCLAVINKRVRKYCHEHKKDGLKKYNSTRAELRGGNLNTQYRNHLNSEGIYVVKPQQRSTDTVNNTKPMKVLSVEGLKKALSKADNITTNVHSQGLRFLNHVMEGMKSKTRSETAVRPRGADDKRRDSIAKRQKTDIRTDPPRDSKRMIELDILSSDDEL